MSAVSTLEEAVSAMNSGGYVWFNYIGAGRDELAELVGPLGLHPLTLEACSDGTVVPGMDEFPGYTFISFNSLHYEEQELLASGVAFIIGHNFLVTVSRAEEQSPSPMEGIMTVIERSMTAVRKGAAWLMHIIIDHLVDGMAGVVEQAEMHLDRAEEEIVALPSYFDPARLTYLRRNLLSLRKNLFYERELLQKISRNGCEWVPEKATLHYRDILGHLSNFLEMTESNRDNLTSLTELYASMLNNKMARDANQTNATVRRLTFITTIFMPLTLLTGIFGMSEWTLMTGGAESMRRSYPLFAAIMVVMGLGGFLLIRWLERGDRRRQD